MAHAGPALRQRRTRRPRRQRQGPGFAGLPPRCGSVVAESAGGRASSSRSRLAGAGRPHDHDGLGPGELGQPVRARGGAGMTSGPKQSWEPWQRPWRPWEIEDSDQTWRSLGAIAHGPVLLAKVPGIAIGLCCLFAHPDRLTAWLVARADTPSSRRSCPLAAKPKQPCRALCGSTGQARPTTARARLRRPLPPAVVPGRTQTTSGTTVARGACRAPHESSGCRPTASWSSKCRGDQRWLPPTRRWIYRSAQIAARQCCS